MKVYKVSKFRTNGQNFQDMHDPEIRTKNSEVGKYFLITEDDNLLSKDRNPENGVPFFGTWTDNFEEFKKDNTIELYCVVDNHSRICPHGNMFDAGCLQEKTYKYKAYFENKNCPVAVGTIDAESKEEAEKILFGISGSWTDENGNVFDTGCPANVEVEEKKTILKTKIIDGKYMLYIKKGKHGNQMFFEHYEVPGLNTESMTEFEEMTGMTQDELVSFAKDFEIWD